MKTLNLSALITIFLCIAATQTLQIANSNVKSVNLQNDTPKARRRLAPSDLIQSRGLDPRVTFSNFRLGSNPGIKIREKSSSDNDDYSIRQRRAASVALAKGNGKKRRGSKNKGRGNKKRKGKGKKKKRRERKERERKDRERRKSKSKGKKDRDRKRTSGRTRRNKPDYFNLKPKKSTRTLSADEIHDRLVGHMNTDSYISSREDRRNYWLNKRINKRGLDHIPSKSSKGKMAVDYADYKGKNGHNKGKMGLELVTDDLGLDEDIFGDNVIQTGGCKVFDKLTGFCIDTGLDSGCIEGDGDEGGLMGCAR